jgi:peptide/nickel transport system substrate-binding protein
MEQMRKRRTMIVGAGLALALGLTACGGDSSNNGNNNGNKAVDVAYDAGNKGVVNPSDKAGGTLRYALTDEPDSMDPGDTYYAFNWDFTRLYARPLVSFPTKTGADGLVAVPDLAESLGVPSDGNKTWTYKLKPGLKYEDGTPITSKDVKYAVARSNYGGVLVNGPKYFAQYLDAADYKGPYEDKNLDNFKGIETPDDQTIVFKLTQPFAEFDYLATNPQTAPVPQAKDTGLKYQEHPMSTGPYKFESYQVGQKFTLVKNTNWDAKTDPLRKQLVDKIEATMKVDANDIDNRLLSGGLDVALDGTGVQAQTRAKVLGSADLKKQADNPVTGFLRYAMLSTQVPPFDNIECRKAVQYAVDRVATQAAWGGEVGGEIATTALPPNILGYEKTTTWEAGPDNRGDVTKAKEALTACGQPNGFATNIAVRGDRPKDVATGEAIQASLDKVGIKAQIKKYPSGDWSAQYAGVPSFVHKNKLGIIIAGWGADWPSGFGFLSQIVDGRAIGKAGNYNQMELNDPAINALLDKGIQTEDTNERNKIWAQVDKKVMESAALLPVVYEKTLLFRPKNLTNMFINPAYGMYDYTQIGLQ